MRAKRWPRPESSAPGGGEPEKEQTDGNDERRRKEPIFELIAPGPFRFRRDVPDLVQRTLQLRKNRGCPDEEHDDAETRRDPRAAGAGVGDDVLNHLRAFRTDVVGNVRHQLATQRSGPIKKGDDR